MKVLQILNRLNLGGAVVQVLYLTKYLRDENETSLLAGMIDEEANEEEFGFLAKEMGIEPVFIPHMHRSIHPINDWRAYKQIRKYIQTYKPDVVHTHASKAGALGRLAAVHEKVPTIIHTFHGHVFNSYFGPLKTSFFLNLERYLAKFTTKIIAISPLQKEELVEKYKICNSDKMEVIPLGFDIAKFRNNLPEKRSAFRSEFNINPDEILIGIVGRLVPIKNHSMFLSGFNKVYQKTQKKIRGIIVGDGELREELKSQCQEMGLGYSDAHDNIHDKPVIFTSWRKDIDAVNAALDIATMTSLNEGTPVSLIEAQTMNIPIVSTDVGGVRDTVNANKTAFLVKSGDVDSFSEELLRLISDDELRKEMGKVGLKFVVENFSLEKLITNVKTIYSQG